MAEPSGIEPISDLAERWRRWTRIVRLFATRHDRRHAIDSSEYQAMHATLTKHCRAMAKSQDSRQPSVVQELLEILAPWVNLDSLARADRQLVCQLFERCRQTQQVLDGPTAAHTIRYRTCRALLVAGLAALAGAVVLTVCNSGPLTSPAVSATKHWFYVACNTVTRNQFQQRVLLGGVLAVFGTMAVVWRSAKQ